MYTYSKIMIVFLFVCFFFFLFFFFVFFFFANGFYIDIAMVILPYYLNLSPRQEAGKCIGEFQKDLKHTS